MANDASIASQVEEWAVTTLTTANDLLDPDKPFKMIGQYDGTTSEAGSRIAAEIVQENRNPIALVFMLDSFTREEGDQTTDRYFDLYVFVGVRNERGGIQARCGDGDRIGIHRAMEFVADTLDGGNPGKSDPTPTRKAIKVKSPTGDILFEQSGLYVGSVKFVVRAAPITPS